jgi:hypothetical protein
VIFLVVGIIGLVIFSPKEVKLKRIMHHIKGGILVLGVLYLLSPVLKTFQNNFADNTTYATAGILVVIHLGWRDYSYIFDKEYKIMSKFMFLEQKESSLMLQFSRFYT